MSWVRRVSERLAFPLNAAGIGAIAGSMVGAGLGLLDPVPLDPMAGLSVGGVIGSGLAAALAWFVDIPVTPLPEWHRHLRARMRVLWVSGPRAPLAVTRSSGGVLSRLPTQRWKLLQSSPVSAEPRGLGRWWPLPHDLAPGELFDRLDGSLLLVGAPGAGKSVLLWEILEALLGRDHDALGGTPVLIELHRWEAYDGGRAAVPPPFAGFVRRELAASPLNVPADVTRLLLDDLVFLLDGLDELSDELAIRCLEALRDFALAGPADRRRRRIVMTCRSDDYERIATRWDTPNTIVRHAVRMLPLPDRVIRRVLDRANPAGRRLGAAAERIPALAGMLHTPLWLSVAAHVYRYTPGPDPLAALAADAEQPAVERALYERWVTLHMRDRPPAYQRHIGFLAERMRVNGQQTIYLEAVQPRWLPEAAAVRWARALAYALATLAGVWVLLGVAALFARALGGSPGMFAGVPRGWVGTALTVGVPAALSAAVVHLAPGAPLRRRRRVTLTVLREVPVVALGAVAVVVALDLAGVVVSPYWFTCYGLFVWFVFRASTTGSDSPRPLVAATRRLVPRRMLVRGNLASGLALGGAVGAFVAVGSRPTADEPLLLIVSGALFLALIASTAFLLHGAMVALPADRGRSPRPLGALWRSGRTGMVTGLSVLPVVVALSVLLALGTFAAGLVADAAGLVADAAGGEPLRRLARIVLDTVSAGVATGATVWGPIAVVTALEGGGGAVVEHVTARLIAAQRGWLPPRLVTLLDDATRDGILYPVGPGWRFRHRTLAGQLAADHRAAHTAGGAVQTRPPPPRHPAPA